MYINSNISVGTRETGVCVLVLKCQMDHPTIFDDDEWNVLFKCHVVDNGE